MFTLAFAVLRMIFTKGGDAVTTPMQQNTTPILLRTVYHLLRIPVFSTTQFLRRAPQVGAELYVV